MTEKTEISGDKILEMEMLEGLSDDQIRDLLKKGYSLRRKTLEEYIAESGKELRVSPEIDWGEPVKGERW